MGKPQSARLGERSQPPRRAAVRGAGPRSRLTETVCPMATLRIRTRAWVLARKVLFGTSKAVQAQF